MKTIVGKKPEITDQAAERVISLVRESPEAALLLGWDESLAELYSAVGRRCAESEEIRSLFSQVKAFPAFEFDCGSPIISEKLESELLIPAGIKKENRFSLCKNTEEYEALLSGEEVICIISVGLKGQVAFNEPGAQYNSAARRQKLTSSTRQLYAPLFGGEEAVPEFGYTAGIGTIVRSKNILVFSTGEKVQDAVFSMLYARDDSVVPAAFLQLPLNVEVYSDDAAAAKL